ncbi:MAG: hypothetical protein FRX49_08709 [Trebouxia sp. A1-2]|nr:MAG: hypothetical protein FRX49_08709 [Trebouxia sp. A1-2]
MAATTVWELVRSEELVALVGCDGDELMWQDETDVVGMDCKAALVGPAVRIVAPVLSPEYESGCTTGSRSADAADAAPERSAARKPNSFSGEGDQGSAAGVSRDDDVGHVVNTGGKQSKTAHAKPTSNNGHNSSNKPFCSPQQRDCHTLMSASYARRMKLHVEQSGEAPLQVAVANGQGTGSSPCRCTVSIQKRRAAAYEKDPAFQDESLLSTQEWPLVDTW